MARTAPKILVTERQRRILDKLERSHKTPQQLVPRVRVVKLSEEGVPNKVGMNAASTHSGCPWV